MRRRVACPTAPGTNGLRVRSPQPNRAWSVTRPRLVPFSLCHLMGRGSLGQRPVAIVGQQQEAGTRRRPAPGGGLHPGEACTERQLAIRLAAVVPSSAKADVVIGRPADRPDSSFERVVRSSLAVVAKCEIAPHCPMRGSEAPMRSAAPARLAVSRETAPARTAGPWLGEAGSRIQAAVAAR